MAKAFHLSTKFSFLFNYKQISFVSAHRPLDFECELILGKINEYHHQPGCHHHWKYCLLFIFAFLCTFFFLFKWTAHISWNNICANKKHVAKVDLLNRSGYHFQHINFNNFSGSFNSMRRYALNVEYCFQTKSIVNSSFPSFPVAQNKEKKTITICGAYTQYTQMYRNIIIFIYHNTLPLINISLIQWKKLPSWRKE